jgi:hypothetical protein
MAPTGTYCPSIWISVYGVMFPGQIQASLELLSGMNITGIPEEALDALIL